MSSAPFVHVTNDAIFKHSTEQCKGEEIHEIINATHTHTKGTFQFQSTKSRYMKYSAIENGNDSNVLLP